MNVDLGPFTLWTQIRRVTAMRLLSVPATTRPPVL